MSTPARAVCPLVTCTMAITALLMGSTVASGLGQAPAAAGKITLPRHQLLLLFDALPGTVRLNLVEKDSAAKTDFQPVVRMDVATVVVARGSLTSANNNDVFCTVRATAKDGAATTVKWIIDNGAAVKKGELLVQLDDGPYLFQLKEQKIKLDLAGADLMKAMEDVDLAARETEGQLLNCDIDIRTAELALKKHGNDDPDEKDILKLHIERNRLNLARHKALGRSRATHALAVVAAKKAGVELEQERYRDIEKQIKACRVVAPQDGLAVYYVAEGVRGGSGSPRPVVAQGEPVREGQKLLQIPDLSRMLLSTRIPEAQISQVRVNQNAIVVVDALPLKKWTARVQGVDSRAAHADFHFRGVKVYHVHVALPEGAANLLPGMSAEVRIETHPVIGVLAIPAQAVVRSAGKTYCYVKDGQEIHKAEVGLGQRNDFNVEIKTGLKEGDTVLRDPIGVLRRVLQPPAPPAGGAAK